MNLSSDPRWATDHYIARILAGLLTISLAVVLFWSAWQLFTWAKEERVARTQLTDTADITLAMRERQLDCLSRNIYYEA
jgi:hypothetical protein